MSSQHKGQLKSYLSKHKRAPSASKDGPARKVASNSSTQKISQSQSKPSAVNKQRSAISSSSSLLRKKQATSRSAFNAVRRIKSIDGMPDELMLEILSYLKIQDLLVCAAVCKKWSKLITDNTLWCGIYKKYARDKNKINFKEKKPPGHWKTECIKRCRDIRNKMASKWLKTVCPYTGLPKKTPDILKKFGFEWQVGLTDYNKMEHNSAHQDVFYFPMSITVRWYSLTWPSFTTVRKLRIFARTPLFMDTASFTPMKNSPFQRCLLLEFELSPTVLKKLPVIAEDENILLYSLADGVMVATFKDGGELAFVSAQIHYTQLIQRSYNGTPTSLYDMDVHTPITDDIDPEYGLHGYTCVVELRNQRKVIWSEAMRHIQYRHCKRAGDCAIFHLVGDDAYLERGVVMSDRLRLPWKTDLFKGIVQDTCLLDMTLMDERGEPFWCISNAVFLKSDGQFEMMSLDYDCTQTYAVVHEDKKGTLKMQLNFNEEREQYDITLLRLHLKMSCVNHWFGTKY